MHAKRLLPTSRSSSFHAIAMEGETHAAILELARTTVVGEGLGSAVADFVVSNFLTRVPGPDDGKGDAY
jgi:hypothetical protein